MSASVWKRDEDPRALPKRSACGRSDAPAHAALVLRLCGAVLVLLGVGCGKASYRVVPVSGRVTLDGDPVPNVHVTFEPLAIKADNPNPGPNSFGVTDQDGRFVLQTVEPREDGAVVGRHRVWIAYEFTRDGQTIDPSPAQKVLPSCCRDGSLQFEVPPEGTELAHFDLLSDP